MAAYKARRKRSAGLQAISGIRTQSTKIPKPWKDDFGTPSGAMSPSMVGRYAPRSEQNLLTGRVRARKRGGNRKLF